MAMVRSKYVGKASLVMASPVFRPDMIRIQCGERFVMRAGAGVPDGANEKPRGSQDRENPTPITESFAYRWLGRLSHRSTGPVPELTPMGPAHRSSTIWDRPRQTAGYYNFTYPLGGEMGPEKGRFNNRTPS